MHDELVAANDDAGVRCVARGDLDTMTLVFALAAVMRLVRDKGLLGAAEIDLALAEAESGLREASIFQNRDPALLPIRTLRAMNRAWPSAPPPTDEQLHDFLTARAEVGCL